MPYVNNQGINIYFETAGQGEPIIFHHGNGNCLKDWYTLGFVEELANNFQLVLVDSRGYGKSDKPHDPAAYSLQNRVDDSIAVLDKLGIEKAHCLGASVGAAMCFLLAKYYPSRFKSYIFATPYFIQFNNDIKQALLQGPEAYVARLENRHNCKIDNETIRQTFLANDTKALWAANSSEWFDYRDYIKYINVPSLIYAGAKEESVPLLTDLAKQLPNCQINIVPNADHVKMYWDSKLVAPIIKNFIMQLEV